MNSVGIYNKGMKDQYSFSYFWAMSMMLGFGNVTPSNSDEAMFMSTLECLSCILFAYNLNEVGTLLTNISKNNEEK